MDSNAPKSIEGERFRTFLINDMQDSKGLKMDWNVIKTQAKRWIGTPGIMECDSGICTHTHGRTLQEARALSERHAVSRVVNVELVESSHTAYAIHEPLKPGLICKGPRYVSQSLWLDKAPPDPDNIHITSSVGFTPVHIAFVDMPAFGPVATVEKEALCNGRPVNSGMDDPEKKDDSKQEMSNDDMIKALYSDMVERKEKEKAAESMGDHAPEKQDSSVKVSWPEKETAPRQTLNEMLAA